jgi:hypothetical protein
MGSPKGITILATPVDVLDTKARAGQIFSPALKLNA